MNKISNCKTCATMRCCPEHCCNWDDCSCKDCEMCGGTLPLEYSKQEILDMETEKKEHEQKKIEEERQRQQAIKEEEIRKKEQVEQEKREAANKAAALEAAAKKEEENKIKNKRDEEYHRTMAMIEETQQKNQSTLNKLNETIDKLGSALQGIQETNTAYNKFQDDFSKTIERLVESIGSQLSAPHKKKPGIGEEHMVPHISTVNDVVDEMANMSHFVVLTGAGISTASNLPTFRGDDGYWTLKNNQDKVKATEFLTHKYFTQNPEEIWRWHHQFRTLGSKNTPNVSHFELANLQLFCKENNRKFTLITQNIDGYHVEALKKISNKDKVNSRTDLDGKSPRNGVNKPLSRKSSHNSDFEERKNSDPPEEIVKGFGLCEDIYEIHGDINYMRCDKECTDRLFTSPEVGCPEEFIPKCPKCKGMARPHTLFFDETYKEEYYRGQSLLKEIENMDCLLVIGTQLETNLASGIVSQAINLGALIVEVNLDPCISYGHVRHLIGKAEEIVPILCERVQKKLSDRVIGI